MVGCVVRVAAPACTARPAGAADPVFAQGVHVHHQQQVARQSAPEASAIDSIHGVMHDYVRTRAFQCCVRTPAVVADQIPEQP